ncbi:MAG: hypothetical protein O7A09_07140, partial [Proteobacteria bacterium]|nr:hypothetical protein [Pseudomonadota bacterium]
DLMPTILDLARAEVPDGLDGESLLGLLEGDDGAARVARSFRTTKKGLRRFSVRSPRHHYIWDANSDETWFFDVRDDPDQLRNLHPSGTAAERELAARLAAWVEEHDTATRPAPARAKRLDPDTAAELRALGYIEEP